MLSFVCRAIFDEKKKKFTDKKFNKKLKIVANDLLERTKF